MSPPFPKPTPPQPSGPEAPACGIDATVIIDLLRLEPLPREGGMWAQTWIDDNGTGIYFLMQPGDFSHLHRLAGPELWHFYAGDPVQMLLLSPDGSHTTPTLDNRFVNGSRPMVAVAPGVWMGAFTTGSWSLVGTTMAPPFDESSFELLGRDQALAAYPGARDQILRVTHREAP